MTDVPKETDLDKAWDGIRYLLTGSSLEESEAHPTLLSRAVMGGTKIGEDIGYGPMSYLTPEEVQEISCALSKISPEELSKKFDVALMNEKKIYPGPFDEKDTEYVAGYYEVMRDYYKDAAKRKNGLLVALM